MFVIKLSIFIFLDDKEKLYVASIQVPSLSQYLTKKEKWAYRTVLEKKKFPMYIELSFERIRTIYRLNSLFFPSWWKMSTSVEKENLIRTGHYGISQESKKN